jgi:hypothetical protein
VRLLPPAPRLVRFGASAAPPMTSFFGKLSLNACAMRSLSPCPRLIGSLRFVSALLRAMLPPLLVLRR